MRLISKLRYAAHCTALVLLIPFLAKAQAPQEGSASASFVSEYSFHVGSLLPNQIDGVTEIQPTVGLRYALGLGGSGSVEAGVLNSHAYGVDYKMASVSLRGDLEAMPDLMTLFYVGPDFHYYSTMGQTTRVTQWGFHVGAGVEMHLGGPFWLRSDMKFNMSPGTALYLGFGFAYRPPGGGGGDN